MSFMGFFLIVIGSLVSIFGAELTTPQALRLLTGAVWITGGWIVLAILER